MKYITRVIWEWGVRAFGMDHMTNTRTRALRILEEAAELAQACDVPREIAFHTLNVVYRRPVGKMEQEIGGILVTVHAFCASQGVTPELMLENEVSRCLSKPPEHFAKRNQEKIDLGLI